MSVKVRQYRKKGETRGWEVDIVLKLPSGEAIRERVKAPVSGRSAAKDWGLRRELVVQERVERAFHGGVVSGLRLVPFERRHAAIATDASTPLEYRFE